MSRTLHGFISAKWRRIVVAVPLASAIAGFSFAATPGIANASSPVPLAGGNHAKSLILNDTGAKLTSWNKTAALCSPNPGYIANGTVSTDSKGDIKLTTTGQHGSCVGLLSPGAYSSGVIEARVNFPGLPGKPGTIANWTGLWLSGQTWPNDGELDAVEVEPVDATNAVTWHSGTQSAPFVASTSGYFANKLPIKSANLKPGWHTVDIVYTKSYFGVYYDGKLFTSYTNSQVTGHPLNIYVTMTNTPDNSWVESRIGAPPINSASSPVTLGLRYLRIWSYK